MKKLLSLICVILFSITLFAQEVPLAGTNIPFTTSVVWTWHPSAFATGYKWNTANLYSSATDVTTDTTKTEGTLTPNLPYTRYVWAYNIYGVSSAVTLTASTTSVWACGDSFTVYHLSGTIAPVDKTVTYGTVTFNSKCWITQNLGATNQGISSTDATEAAAGWMWQFNKKQGYKYDASRLPATTWISSISESSNWLTANDPCQELGTGWRLPTLTEMTAADTWNNITQAYASVLKIHGGGRLYYSNGALGLRGSDAVLWTNTQSSTTYGNRLYVTSTSSAMGTSLKAFAYSIRCVK